MNYQSNYIKNNYFLQFTGTIYRIGWINFLQKLKYEWKRDISRTRIEHQQTRLFAPVWCFPLGEVDRRPYILTATLENSARRSDSEARLQASVRTQCGPASRQTTNFRPKVDLLTLKTRVNDASTLIYITRTQSYFIKLSVYISPRFHDLGTKFLSRSRIRYVYINISEL